VGTSTNLARQDHTHDGLALTGAQSASGAKNFTTSLQTAQFGVGVAPGTTRARIVSTVDEIGLQVEQVTVTGSNPLLGTISFDTGGTGFAAKVTGDTVNRIAIKASGNIEFGPGNGARDATLYRSNTATLNVTNQLWIDGTAPTAAGHATRKDYVDNNFDSLTGAQTISGVKTFTGAPILQQSAAGTTALKVQVTGDTTPRLTIGADGTMSWGPGNAAADIVINRTSGSSLSNSSNWQSSRSATSGTAYTALVTGDTFDRFRIYADGLHEWGPGNAARDTNLYRSAANVLSTDDAFAALVQTVSSGTAATNFTVTSFSGRKTCGICTVYVSLTYTGSTLTADSAGNLADTLCFTLPAGYIPPIAVVEAYDKSGIATGDVFIDTDGTCKLKTLSPTATLANTGTVTFNATFVL
jgi:hypothetical protein